MIDGVSMVSTQRSTFSPILASEGIDGLLNVLRTQIEDGLPAEALTGTTDDKVVP